MASWVQYCATKRQEKRSKYLSLQTHFLSWLWLGNASSDQVEPAGTWSSFPWGSVLPGSETRRAVWTLSNDCFQVDRFWGTQICRNGCRIRRSLGTKEVPRGVKEGTGPCWIHLKGTDPGWVLRVKSQETRSGRCEGGRGMRRWRGVTGESLEHPTPSLEVYGHCPPLNGC